jgi:hypothetical protein
VGCPRVIGNGEGKGTGFIEKADKLGNEFGNYLAQTLHLRD